MPCDINRLLMQLDICLRFGGVEGAKLSEPSVQDCGAGSPTGVGAHKLVTWGSVQFW